MAKEIRLSRIEQEAVHGVATEEHAERHCLAVGERDLDRPGQASEFQLGLDHVAPFAMPAGVTDDPVVDHGRFADDDDVAASLQGMNAKAHLERASFGICFDLESVQ